MLPAFCNLPLTWDPKIISGSSASAVLTALISYCTGSLARGLAGSLALATAAVLHGALQRIIA